MSRVSNSSLPLRIPGFWSTGAAGNSFGGGGSFDHTVRANRIESTMGTNVDSSAVVTGYGRYVSTIPAEVQIRRICFIGVYCPRP